MTPLNIEDLERLLAEAALTRLQTDWIPMCAEENIEEGWRIHDFPDEPNSQGMMIAHYLCGGLEEEPARLFVAAVNALPQLLAAVRDGERYRAALKEIADHRPAQLVGAGDGGTYVLTGQEYGECVNIARQALHPTPREGTL